MSNFMKRVVSVVLLIAMLVSCANLTWAAALLSEGSSAGGSSDSLTLGQVIANNYDYLSAKEKAILSATALVGARYDISYPDNSDELIDIDTETKTVTAKNYVDGEYVWVPTSATVTYKNDDGTDADPAVFEFGDSDNVSITCPSDRYSVEVSYVLYADVSVDEQLALVNAPASLVSGIGDLNSLLKMSGEFNVAAQLVQNLYPFTEEGGYRYKMNGIEFHKEITEELHPDTYRAIRTLYSECQENGGSLKLGKLLESCNDAQKLQFIMRNADELKKECAELYSALDIICNNDKSDTKAFFTWFTPGGTFYNYADDTIRSLAKTAVLAYDMTGDLVDVLAKINDKADGAFAGTDVIRSDASATEMKELSALVDAKGEVNTYDASKISEKLVVAETSVSKGVDQYKVNATIKANVVNADTADTADTVEVPDVKRVTLVLDAGISSDDIMTAIKNSGVIDSALKAWGDNYATYNINEENYQVSVNGLVDELDSDLDVEIVYSPKSCTIHFAYGEDDMTVPYGYGFTLPANEDAEKSYDYVVNGVDKRETEVIRIVGETTVDRTAGAATEKYTVPQIIVKGDIPGVELTAEESSIITSFAIKLDDNDYKYFRSPSDADELVNINDNGGYTVEARSLYAGPSVGKYWTPAECNVYLGDVVVETVKMEDGKCSLTVDRFDRAEVSYILDLGDVDGIGDRIDYYINLPDQLVREAEAQMAELEKLVKIFDDARVKNNFTYENMDMAASDKVCSPEVVEIIENWLKVAFDNKTLILATYIENYKNQGLAYYYGKDGIVSHYDQIKYQVEEMKKCLELVWDDEKLQETIESNEKIKNNIGFIENLKDKIAELDFESIPVNAAIDQSSSTATLRDFANAIVAAKGNTSAHTASAVSVVFPAKVNAYAPGQKSITVNVALNNSNGNTLKTEAISLAYGIDHVLGAEDAADIQNKVNAIISSFGIETAYYDINDDILPGVGYTVENNVTFDVVCAPRSYDVRVEDIASGSEIINTVYPAEELTVVLPGCSETGYKYSYTINGVEIKLVSTAANVNYEFASAAELVAFVENGGVIKCTRIDSYKEDILAFVNDVNSIFAKNGAVFNMNGQQCLMLALIPMEDADGNLSVVFRVSPANVSVFTEDFIKNVINDLSKVLAKYSYIGLNGKTLWNKALYIQTVIDAVLASDLSLDYVAKLIKDNGDLVEMTDVADATVIGAENGTIKVGSNVINNTDVLGAKLMAADGKLGADAENGKDFKLYITIEDFDLKANALSKLDRAIAKVQQYVDVACKDGSLAVSLRVPEKLYPYYLAAQSIPGNVSIADIYDDDLGTDIAYCIDLVRELVGDSDLTVGTLQRTLAMVGVDRDLSEYSKLFSYARSAAAYILNAASVEGSSDNGTYTGVASIGIREALEKFGFDQLTLGFIAEAAEDSEGITAPFTFTLKNAEEDYGYQAAVLDIHASKLDKFTFTKDLAKTLANASENTVIILLSDTEVGNVTVKNSVILDLNGKMLTGDLSAKNNVKIFDSCVSSTDAGSVNGSVTGNFTILGGQYSDDVTAMLKDGYIQNDNGFVVNKYYTVEENGNDINIILSPDFLEIDSLPNLKAILADVAVDLAKNMYTNAYFAVDGNAVYSVEIEDVLGLKGKGKTNLVQTAIDFIDLDGVEAIVNQMLKDLTDFGAMKANLDSGKALVSYTATTKPWDIKLSLAGDKNDNYINAAIQPGETETERTVNLLIGDPADEVSALLGALDGVLTVDASVTLDGITYNGGKSVSVDAGAVADVLVDLTSNSDYAFVVAGILATTAKDETRNALVDAMRTYLEDHTTRDLLKAIENVTTAELVKAVKNIKNADFAAILMNLGVDSDSAIELYNTYKNVIRIASVLANKIDVTGSDRKLGTVGVTDEYATYSVSRENWHRCDITLTLKLLAEDKAIVVIGKDSSVIKAAYDADELCEALENAESGDRVIINTDNVVLSTDAVVAADIEIENAANITFDNAEIKLAAVDVKITADAAIEVASDVVGYQLADVVDNVYYLEPMAIQVLDTDDNIIGGYEANELAKAVNENKGIILVNADAALEGDATVTSTVRIRVADGAAIDSNGHSFILANADACIISHVELESVEVAAALAEQYTVKAEEGENTYCYTLEEIVVEVPAIVVTDYTGAVKNTYKAEELAKALEEAATGSLITINEYVELDRDVNVGAQIVVYTTVANIGIANDAEITLTNIAAVIWANVELPVVSGIDGYEAKAEIDPANGFVKHELVEKEEPPVPNYTITAENADGEVEYFEDVYDLAEVLAEIEDGAVVTILSADVTLSDTDVAVSFEIKLADGVEVSLDGTITLTVESVVVTSAVKLTVESGVDGYAVKAEEDSTPYTYSLEKEAVTTITVEKNGETTEYKDVYDLAEVLAEIEDGAVVTILSGDVTLSDADVAVSFEIKLADGVEAALNGTITAKKSGVRIVSAVELNVVSDVDGYDVWTIVNGDTYIYRVAKKAATVEEPAIIVVHQNKTETAYAADQLAAAVENAEKGDLINVNKPVVLDTDAEVTTIVSIAYVKNISYANDAAFKLASTDAKLIANADLNVVSGVPDYVVVKNGLVYELVRDISNYVASVNETDYYMSVEEAVAAAQDGDVVTVYTESNEDITVETKIVLKGASNVKGTVTLGADAEILADGTVNTATAEGYYVVETVNGNDTVTYTVAQYAVKLDDNGEVSYFDTLQAAVDAATADAFNAHITVILPVNEDVAVGKQIEILNAANVTGIFTLTAPEAGITADGALSNVKSGVEYYEVEENGTAYSLKAVAPEILVPVVKVENDGLIRGAKVDAENKYIFLDVAPTGFSAEDFNEFITFEAVNATEVTASVNAEGMICNGAAVTAFATNTSGTSATVTYTVIILGDVNADGYIDTGDAVAIRTFYVGENDLTELALLAGDVNCDGEVDTGDAVNIATKYTELWETGKYVSKLGE